MSATAYGLQGTWSCIELHRQCRGRCHKVGLPWQLLTSAARQPFRPKLAASTTVAVRSAAHFELRYNPAVQYRDVLNLLGHSPFPRLSRFSHYLARAIAHQLKIYYAAEETRRPPTT